MFPAFAGCLTGEFRFLRALVRGSTRILWIARGIWVRVTRGIRIEGIR